MRPKNNNNDNQINKLLLSGNISSDVKLGWRQTRLDF